MNENSSIAVIGTGLIGGSILKALKPKNLNLIAVSRSTETVNKAKELNIANEYSTSLDAVKNADVVFICTPIDKIIPTIEEVRNIVNADCIITDVASIKTPIINFVNDYRFPTNFIGGHPMAGTENKGVDFATDNLFVGAKWVLTPSKWSDQEDIEILNELINLMGAKTVLADPESHDKAVALISHLPLLVSQALFGMINDLPDKNIRELAMILAASGFRDTTRLAATNPELSKNMLFENKVNVRESAKNFIDYFTALDKDLDLDEEKFLDRIINIASGRKSLYSPDGKNIYQ